MDNPISLSRLRAINSDDMAFLSELYACTRAAEMNLTSWSADQKKFFLYSQFQLQHNYYQQQFPKAKFKIIELDRLSIGRLYYGWEKNNLRLIDISLLPEYQGQGTGGQLIRELMDLVVEKKGTFSLHVDINNPARNWYLKLGFIPSDNSPSLVNGIYQKLHWSAKFLDASIVSDN